jgi:ornithine cyclodeaminase/alanine dehydrogenase-like protein (mu-crystallin family)
VPWVDADTIFRVLPWADAVEAIGSALSVGLNPAADLRRVGVTIGGGELLLMPSQVAERVGIKVASVAPGNPFRGLPRVQAVYILMDAATLTPLALLDGTALTTVRTPAVSAYVVARLAPPEARTLTVFGNGPQSWGHVCAISSVRPIREVNVVGRDTRRTANLVERLCSEGCDARPGDAESVTTADIVVCATSATTPLFDGDLIQNHACVVAVGSHSPFNRELDDALMGRARVVVEDRATALREAGDILLAVNSGALNPATILDLTEVAATEQWTSTGPTVFKSVGMGWQDLVTAAEVVKRVAPYAHSPSIN